MTELQNIALVYESTILVVEDASARVEYLLNKYRSAWAQSIIDREYGDHDDENKTSNYMTYQSQAYEKFHIVVDELDPTHGKYSEWYIKQMIKNNTEEHWFINVYGMMPEDRYKIKEILQAYDQYKQKFPVDKRDINKLNYKEVIALVKPIMEEQQELSKKALAKKIKSEETTKLIDNLDGWTVVVPLSKQSAQYYGAQTRWCTAAREEEYNRFDEYNNNGPLFIFISEHTKYQWWSDITNYFNRDYEGDLNDLVMFKDATDSNARIKAIPDYVWYATIDAHTTYYQISDSLELMGHWLEKTNIE